jgi:diguanylate cyclase (GGDEF)-like protein
VFQAISDGKLAVNCLGITTGIFIMFVRFQDEQITNDILTTLHNRYALDTHINDKMKEYSSGNRKGSALYFIMMDVDNFKSINDVYGHNEGDEVLRSIAFQLKKVGMKYKAELFLARYAGDEFCAVFESPSRERVDELVSDIKNEVSLLSEERGHHMSISVGYAAYAGKNMDIETLFELADKALYIDKFGAKPENIPQEIETDVEI